MVLWEDYPPKIRIFNMSNFWGSLQVLWEDYLAKYCWKRDAHHYNEFIYRQALKGSKGGKVSKRKALATSEQSLKPWVELGISRATYYRKKSAKK
jgi:hypothetical protein